MDMGFSREHCIAALLHTTSIEQATEFLLTRPLATSLGGGGATAAVSETTPMIGSHHDVTSIMIGPIMNGREFRL